MKYKLKEKWILKYYNNHLIDKLHNFLQGNVDVKDYVVRFDDYNFLL